MQLLTGEIMPDTRHDLATGTVFRVARESYGRMETHIVLVDASFYMNVDTPEEALWYEITTLRMGQTYSPSIERKTVRSNDEFLNNIQHVELEEALTEFTRQSLLAAQEVANAEANLLSAKLRRLSFAAVADRIGDML